MKNMSSDHPYRLGLAALKAPTPQRLAPLLSHHLIEVESTSLSRACIYRASRFGCVHAVGDNLARLLHELHPIA